MAPSPETAPGTVPAGSTAQWRDRKRYLWLIGLVVPSLAFIAIGMWTLTGWGAWFWIGPVVILGIVPAIDLVAGLDRSNPPDDVIEALERDRYYRWITYLFLPIQYAGFVGAFWVMTHLRPVGRRPGRHRDLDRLHRRHRHQHRPRARPQEGGQRALAVQDRSGPELLRPLLHRAQPRSPRAGRHPRGPRVGSARRELLRVLAAHRRRVAPLGVEPGEAADRSPQAAPLAALERRAQRLADVGGAVGRHDRGLRARDHAVPGDPGGRRLLAARGRQLHGALRDAAAEGRGRRARALRAGRSLALVELQQHRDQRAALPPAAPQRPPREPHPALPVAARLRGEPGAADGVRRDDRARDRPRRLAPRDGPEGARPLRRRRHAGQPQPAQARPAPGDVRRSDPDRRPAQRLTDVEP